MPTPGPPGPATPAAPIDPFQPVAGPLQGLGPPFPPPLLPLPSTVMPEAPTLFGFTDGALPFDDCPPGPPFCCPAPPHAPVEGGPPPAPCCCGPPPAAPTDAFDCCAELPGPPPPPIGPHVLPVGLFVAAGVPQALVPLLMESSPPPTNLNRMQCALWRMVDSSCVKRNSSENRTKLELGAIRGAGNCGRTLY
uniref:Uncharacterized protein n=1 Tax=Anopheles culicifacies TaxID=139723 RepID=A0A182LVF5_9DIPT